MSGVFRNQQEFVGAVQPAAKSSWRKLPPVWAAPYKRWTRYCGLLASAVLVGETWAQTQCPGLQAYYPASATTATREQWQALLPRLEPLFDSCLASAEYFALLGAARLNTGQVAQAQEALERALLLEPENGAAQIDYAETLYLAGELFAALETNSKLLSRTDLPNELRPVLEARERFWQQQTTTKLFLVEATAGHDSNLNGAPTHRDLTVTFAGLPVVLTLDRQFQRQSGEFGAIRLAMDWQQRTASSAYGLQASSRFRHANQKNTDLAELDWRYHYRWNQRRHSWELSAGTSHLNFGGDSLYDVAEARAKLLWGLTSFCQPALESVIQQLQYPGQEIMNGLELRLNASYGCAQPNGRHALGFTAGLLRNYAQKQQRPGADREGWNAQIEWQYRQGPHQIVSQISYLSLDDQRGYSPLLKNGAQRKVTNTTLALRYQWAFSERAAVLISASKQSQQSNLRPFANRGTVLEAGVAVGF